MSFLKGKKLRYLYLLALFQLVAGPLVLLQVTVLCKLTVREAPRQGIPLAFQKAWQSDEFQSALVDSDHALKRDPKSPLPTSDPKAKLLKAKMPVAIWNQSVPLRDIAATGLMPCSDWARLWTPIWPQAPPGPPPRLG